MLRPDTAGMFVEAAIGAGLVALATWHPIGYGGMHTFLQICGVLFIAGSFFQPEMMNRRKRKKPKEQQDEQQQQQGGSA